MFYNPLMDNLGAEFPCCCLEVAGAAAAAFPTQHFHSHPPHSFHNMELHCIPITKKFLRTSLEFDCERSGTGEFTTWGSKDRRCSWKQSCAKLTDPDIPLFTKKWRHLGQAGRRCKHQTSEVIVIIIDNFTSNDSFLLWSTSGTQSINGQWWGGAFLRCCFYLNS